MFGVSRLIQILSRKGTIMFGVSRLIQILSRKGTIMFGVSRLYIFTQFFVFWALKYTFLNDLC